MSRKPACRLLADIGGTNVRFALQVSGSEPCSFRSLRTADYPDLQSTITAYLNQPPAKAAPKQAAFAIASPISGDRVALTNHDWTFSIEEIRKSFQLDQLHVLNDFTAIALSIPELPSEALRKIGGGMAAADAPIAVLGPGTGLGVSGLMPTAKGEWMAFSSEGGHVTMPAATQAEADALGKLRERFGHVSAERLASGPGLLNLYGALSKNFMKNSAPASPDALTRRAFEENDPDCLATLHMFCDMLGTVAGDLALSLGAQGGVYVAGGIVPKFVDFFAASGFRTRFEQKGRFADYLAAIPTFVICHPEPAFLGLASLLDHAKD